MDALADSKERNRHVESYLSMTAELTSLIPVHFNGLQTRAAASVVCRRYRLLYHFKWNLL